MFRCLGRRRNTYLYIGIILICLVALFQSFILDIFKQSVPRRYCSGVGMCFGLGLNLRQLSPHLPLGVNSSSSADDSHPVADSRWGGSRGWNGTNMADMVANMTPGHNHPQSPHFFPDTNMKSSAGGDVVGVRIPAHSHAAATRVYTQINGGQIIGGKSQGTTLSSAHSSWFDSRRNDTGIPRWQRRLLNNSTRPSRHFKYFLVELLQVRIYAHDKAKWSIRELKQWMHFLFLAGVEHIYLCDHYQQQSECLQEPLKKYIDLKLVTYISWKAIKHPMTAQVECYQYIIDTYGNQTRFQMAIDMDEYPYSPVDFGEGFLPRYLKNVNNQGYGHRVSEISMNNYLMLGQGDRTQDMVISRINRMTPKPANHLVKPIFKPERVRAGLHHNYLRRGIAIYANDSHLRMLHYWGARLQNWGNDTPIVLNMSEEMNKMREGWAGRVRRSLLAFGETDAFSTGTGP